jgi:Ca2+-binding RTX toxin-like protein
LYPIFIIKFKTSYNFSKIISKHLTNTNLYFLEGESWRVFNIITKRVDPDLRLVSLITTVAVTVLFLHLNQIGWAAVIDCPETTDVCNGTPGNDVIDGPFTVEGFIHGLGGDDVIIGHGSAKSGNYIFGDNGSDILLGGPGNDGLYGGRGNDMYDGNSGGDTISETYYKEGPLVKNDDIISGEEGNDYIESGEGVDRIHGGPGNDAIYADTTNGAYRDFSYDSVNCGSGTDIVAINSGDDVVDSNCDLVMDHDR